MGYARDVDAIKEYLLMKSGENLSEDEICKLERRLCREIKNRKLRVRFLAWYIKNHATEVVSRHNEALAEVGVWFAKNEPAYTELKWYPCFKEHLSSENLEYMVYLLENAYEANPENIDIFFNFVPLAISVDIDPRRILKLVEK